MAAIQTALDGHADTPAGIAAGEVPVWNGAAWVRSSVTQLAATSVIPSGRGTSLPAAPYDGQAYVLTDSLAAPTYNWKFRYNSSSASTYKWEFIGGAPATASIGADETSATWNAWTDLTTVGPLITVARAGEYSVSGNASMYTTGAAGPPLYLGIALGATNPTDPQIAQASEPISTYTIQLALSESLIAAGVTAGENIRLRYFGAASGTVHGIKRNIAVLPRRVS